MLLRLFISSRQFLLFTAPRLHSSSIVTCSTVVQPLRFLIKHKYNYSSTPIRAFAISGQKQPWYMSQPEPKSTLDWVNAEEVLNWLEDDNKVAGKDYLLVDVRRNDHEGGTIEGSANFPAQSFVDARATLFNLIAAAGVKKVVFYCGSCGGRGPRVAGWFKDYVEEQNNKGVEVLVLTGGIKGWVKNGEKYTGRMSSFEAEAWK